MELPERNSQGRELPGEGNSQRSEIRFVGDSLKFNSQQSEIQVAGDSLKFRGTPSRVKFKLLGSSEGSSSRRFVRKFLYIYMYMMLFFY